MTERSAGTAGRSPGAGCSAWSAPAPPASLAAGAAGGVDRPRDRARTDGVRRRAADDAVPFTGAHQAGIVTPAQDRLHFVAFDVTTDDRDELVEMLQAWTAAARRMTAGRDAGPVGAVDGEPVRAAGRHRRGASGCRPSGLTLTIGFGPTLFTTADGTDRFGLAARRPAPLAELPRVPRRPARPGDQRRRPVRPGLRQRPAGRGARRPQPGPARRRRGQRALVAARLRPHVVDQHRPGDAAQPVRLQGRHEQPQGRERRRRWTGSSGWPTATAAPTGWPAAPTWSPAGSGC